VLSGPFRRAMGSELTEQRGIGVDLDEQGFGQLKMIS